MVPLLPLLAAGGVILGGAAILGALPGRRRSPRRNSRDPLNERVELLRALSRLRLEPTPYVPQPGDHIRVRCWFGPIPYHHHGIVSWDFQNNRPNAIHYGSGMDENAGFGIKAQKRSAVVRQTDLERFAGSAGLGAIELVERPQNTWPVLTRAYSALGSELWAEGTYDLRCNNCEHFSRWCTGGWGYSQQVVNFSILRTGISAAASALAHRLYASVVARVGAALGVGYLLPGLGWLLLGAGILYAGYELAKGLGFCCNGHRAEIDGRDIRRAALAQGIQFA
jgi:hypothetical protein